MKRIKKNEKVEESQSFSVQNEQISSFSGGEQTTGKKLNKTQKNQQSKLKQKRQKKSVDDASIKSSGIAK